MNEIIESGAGIRGFWKGADTLLARSFWYGGFRPYFWSLFYNYFNQDPRRTVHWTGVSLAGFLGGFCAGVITNPIDIVYNRQVADALYPKHLQRNYSSFIDGLVKVNAEGALFRGAIAGGFAYGMMHVGMSNIYDYLKEYLYWSFGPAHWLRPVILAPTVFCGVCFYLPFDNIRTRYHTMTPLPNGEMPYQSFTQTIGRIFYYESNLQKYSSPISMLAGGVPAFIRMFLSFYIGIGMTDIAFRYNYKEGDFWEGSTVFGGPYQGFIAHEPAHIDRYDAGTYSPFKSTSRVEKNVSLGPGTQSYIKY